MLGQFVFAKLKNEAQQQRIRLVFATHEVLLRSQALRRIESALQQLELSFVTSLLANQRPMVAEGQPFISEILIIEGNAAGKTTN